LLGGFVFLKQKKPFHSCCWSMRLKSHKFCHFWP
jgi:hypothetical protein